MVESIRRVGVHPRVLSETERVIRQRLTEEISRLREELAAMQVRVKNFKSQSARLRNADVRRETELKEQIAAGEARAAALKNEIQSRERSPLDEAELRKTMVSFEVLWATMNVQQQGHMLQQLVEKVGYEGRSGRVTVSFKSASVKELCAK